MVKQLAAASRARAALPQSRRPPPQEVEGPSSRESQRCPDRARSAGPATPPTPARFAASIVPASVRPPGGGHHYRVVNSSNKLSAILGIDGRTCQGAKVIQLDPAPGTGSADTTPDRGSRPASAGEGDLQR